MISPCKKQLTLILIYLGYTPTVLLIYFQKFLFRSRRFPLPVRRRFSACSRFCWSWYVEGDSRCRRHFLQEQNVRVPLHWWCRHLHSLIRIWLLVTIHCRWTASPPLRNPLKLRHLVKFEMSRKLQNQYLFMTFFIGIFSYFIFKKQIWGVLKLPHMIIIYTKRIAIAISM